MTIVGDMVETDQEYEYFCRLRRILLPGLINKRWISSVMINLAAKRFGNRILEVGCGTGSGILGAYPEKVVGIDVNRYAVDFCCRKGFRACHIVAGRPYPFSNGSFDVCVLDNVLEHIEDPGQTIDECLRVTTGTGGMIVVVPGEKGYAVDPDHRKYYATENLMRLDSRLQLVKLFSLPFIFKSSTISSVFASYCLAAVYRKKQR